jgi:hypothetical protein
LEELVGIIAPESWRGRSMNQILAILGRVPPSNSAFDGFFLLAAGLLGLLSIPAQISKMNSLKLWPILALQLVVLLAFVIGGLVILSKKL